MSVCLWNARSIVNKLSGFLSFVYSSSIAVFALTETWLSDSFCDGEILPSDFTVYRRDRLSRGGGVLLAVHSSLSSSCFDSPPDLEAVCATVANGSGSDFYFVSFMFPLR